MVVAHIQKCTCSQKLSNRNLHKKGKCKYFSFNLKKESKKERKKESRKSFHKTPRLQEQQSFTDIKI